MKSPVSIPSLSVNFSQMLCSKKTTTIKTMWRAKRGEEEEEKALKDRINHLLISAIFFDAFDVSQRKRIILSFLFMNKKNSNKDLLDITSLTHHQVNVPKKCVPERFNFMSSVFSVIKLCNEITTLFIGADIDKKNWQGRTALMMATQESHGNVVSSLVKLGANVNLRDKDGYSALDLAAKFGLEEVALTLLKNGADLKIGNLYSDFQQRRKCYSKF